MGRSVFGKQLCQMVSGQTLENGSRINVWSCKRSGVQYPSMESSDPRDDHPLVDMFYTKRFRHIGGNIGGAMEQLLVVSIDSFGFFISDNSRDYWSFEWVGTWNKQLLTLIIHMDIPIDIPMHMLVAELTNYQTVISQSKLITRSFRQKTADFEALATGTFYMVFLKFLAAFLIYVRDPGEWSTYCRYPPGFWKAGGSDGMMEWRNPSFLMSLDIYIYITVYTYTYIYIRSSGKQREVAAQLWVLRAQPG